MSFKRFIRFLSETGRMDIGSAGTLRHFLNHFQEEPHRAES